MRGKEKDDRRQKGAGWGQGEIIQEWKWGWAEKEMSIAAR